MHLGKKIKLLRLAKGWSQNELAIKIGRSRHLVAYIEQTGKINKGTLAIVSEVLGVPAKILASYSISEDKDTKLHSVISKLEETINELNEKCSAMNAKLAELEKKCPSQN